MNYTKIFSRLRGCVLISSVNTLSSMTRLPSSQKPKCEIIPTVSQIDSEIISIMDPVSLGKYDAHAMYIINKNLIYETTDRYKTYKDDDGAELI